MPKAKRERRERTDHYHLIQQWCHTPEQRLYEGFARVSFSASRQARTARAKDRYERRCRTIRAVLATAGQEARKGETRMILEAMKMEHSIRTPYDEVAPSLLTETATWYRPIPCCWRWQRRKPMGKTYWQAIVEADEPVPANRSVAERSLLLGSTDPRPARSPDVVAGATSGLLSPFFVAPVHQQTFTEVRSFICYQP
jgi:hypothetical protein